MSESIKMEFNRECKHSVRYDAAEPTSCIKSVYIHKSALPSEHPKTVTLTLEA